MTASWAIDKTRQLAFSTFQADSPPARRAVEINTKILISSAYLFNCVKNTATQKRLKLSSNHILISFPDLLLSAESQSVAILCGVGWRCANIDIL